MNAYKEFMNRVFGLDYQLQQAEGNPQRIRSIVDEGNCNIQLITMMAEDAMEYVAGTVIENGIDDTMTQITRIERLHSHYIDTLAEHNVMYACEV